MSALHSSGDWQVHHSKKYNASYWFNSATGETSWSKPSGLLVSATKDTKVPSATKSSDEDEPRAKRFRSLGAEDVAQQAPRPAGAKVAIIVPFRDLHVEQKRSEHLKRFVPEMSRCVCLRSSRYDFDVWCSHRFLDGHEFVIYIIEQSDDKKEFNRGKLLNAGFHIASAEGCRVFIFHDVDLMPSAELLSYYTTVPTGKSPVHIARVWNRYNSNDKYFGGIISFSKEQFEEINGYPNNFWGWGGEDDELMKRAQEVRNADGST